MSFKKTVLCFKNLFIFEQRKIIFEIYLNNYDLNNSYLSDKFGTNWFGFSGKKYMRLDDLLSSENFDSINHK